MPSNTVKFTPEKPAKEKRSHGLGITIFSAAILVVIVVTFIGAPVVSKVSEQSGATFGSYDGISIDLIQGNAFSQQIQQISRFYEQFNQGASNLDYQRQLIWRQAFEQTALQIGLKREAELAGMVVSNTKVNDALHSHPSYLKDGKFSDALYRDTSAAEQFRLFSETQTNLLIQQYAADHTTGPLLSSATSSFVAALAYPQRKFSFITFTDADYPQALVAEYAQKNKTLFRTIDLSRITVTSSESDANKVREEALKGEKAFSDLAKTYSKDALADSGGALNVRHYYELKSEITKTEDLDKVFDLAKGGISAVIKGEKSWTIYKANSPATDADVSNADILAVVRSYIARNDRGLLEDNLETQAKAFAETAKNDFAGAAKKVGKVVSDSGWVALNFGNHDLLPSLTDASKDSIFRGLASNEDFFKKAFRTPVGQISAPILASPAVLLVKVDQVKTSPAADDKPILASSVSDSFASDRSRQLEQSILKSPKFKDQFQGEFNRMTQVQ